MLFAWPCIMHETIHNLLSLVYHLQLINNVILASCFFSICHCCLSNSVYEDWLVPFCTCALSSQKSVLEQTISLCVFQNSLFYSCEYLTSGHLLSQWGGIWLLKIQRELPVTGEMHKYINSLLKRSFLLWPFGSFLPPLSGRPSLFSLSCHSAYSCIALYP